MHILAISPPGFGALDLLRDTCGDDELVISAEAGEILNVVRDAEIVVIHPRLAHLMRAAWPEARHLRWIHALSAGVETLLFPELTASDVVVTNGRGIFGPALAEFVLGAMLHFAKRMRRLLADQRDRQWRPFTVDRLEGSSVGIIGHGGIGQAVERLATAFGMRVVSVRRGSARAELEELLRESNYVLVCTPLTEETRGMIGRKELSLMRRDAVLINVGRGAVVDEAALVDELRQHRIGGAALDVFATEPLPPDHPLWSLDNVLISPHCADHTSDSHPLAMQLFIDNLARYRSGQTLVNIVDKTRGY